MFQIINTSFSSTYSSDASRSCAYLSLGQCSQTLQAFYTVHVFGQTPI